MQIAKINDDYFIDSDGNVYSRPRHKTLGGVLKPTLNAYGYPWVGMTIDGRKQKKLIHRLLAEAFIPNPENLPTVNHKDGNKRNNALSNLEWASYSENNQHAWNTGLKRTHAASGERYIYLCKDTNRYRVVVKADRRSHNLGRYTTLADAIRHRDEFISSLAA